jgi:pyruvate dehydrogenase E2 component (dihydrolipoamide acetyltransferase)
VKDSEVKTEPVEKEAEESKAASVPLSDVGVFLPALGDGVDSGIVAGVLVKVGDELEEGNALIELETDKAVLPVPTPIPGKVIKLNIKAGDTLKVGGLIANIEAIAVQETASISSVSVDPKTKAIKSDSANKKPEVVGKIQNTSSATSSSGKVLSAGPATRKFARELGVDLSRVTGSQRGGRIDIDDVKKFVKEQNSGAKKSVAQGHGFSPIELPDFSKYGEVKVEAATNLRKIISERMSRNWATIPHVNQFQDIDISEISKIAKSHGAEFKEKGSSASPTNFFIKAMTMCLKEFPIFNSSFDSERNDIIMKNYFNIGVAVDTPSGLIVPVLKGVDQMSIFDIGKNLKELAQKTRDRKIVPDDLSGGSMTLTNLGGIGGTHFTPIINAPEVAILGLGRAQVKPVYIDGELKPRSIAQITLAYDHRVIDGADGARFVHRLKDIMENFNKYLLGAPA